MSEPALFAPRLAAALIGLAIVVFAASLLLTGGGPSEGEEWGANSWSISAIGGGALYQTLAATGRLVARTRGNSSTLGDDVVLVLDEPTQDLLADAFRAKLKSAKRVLLILPKRDGEPDPDHAGWIAETSPAAPALPEAALFSLDSAAKIVRDTPPTRFDVNALAAAPSLVEPAQFAASKALKPIVALGDDILVGEIDDQDRRVVVLTDPDPVENHGLALPGNADFAMALFDWIGGGKSRFVFDETIHGFSGAAGGASFSAPALRMLRFPGDLILVQALVALLLLIAASVGRFGPPLPAPRAFSSGKRALIASIAGLIDFGGHHGETLRRYIEAIAADGAAQLRPPPGLAAAERAQWVDRAATARGARRTASDILAAARNASNRDLGALLAAAQAIHQWRGEIGHGAG